MNGSMTLVGRFEALKKNYEEVVIQNEYLRNQLARSIRNQRRNLHSTPSSTLSEANQEDQRGREQPFCFLK